MSFFKDLWVFLWVSLIWVNTGWAQMGERILKAKCWGGKVVLEFGDVCVQNCEWVY